MRTRRAQAGCQRQWINKRHMVCGLKLKPVHIRRFHLDKDQEYQALLTPGMGWPKAAILAINALCVKRKKL
jgi:hypothetical protein